ncbi:MAG: GAF domain-containing protein [Nitrospirota bacterium]|jgi:hypothetical protein
MNQYKQLRRLEDLIIKMRGRIIELHNYNRMMKILNSISDEKSFERVLKVLSEGFKIDGCSLMVFGGNKLETVAFYGSHQTAQILTGKGTLFFSDKTLKDVKVQRMRTNAGILLCLPIIKGVGYTLGVLNLYRNSVFSDEAFSETDQRLFNDIANQIGVAIERILSVG